MNRLAAHFCPSGLGWGLVFLVALAATAGAEEQRGRAIEFSPSRSGAAITNRSAANRQQLQEDMLEQQARDRITKPFRANPDSLEGVLAAPPPQPRGLSPAEIKRLKEYIAQRNNWMFADPDAINKATSPDDPSQFDASASEETGLEKNSLQALKRFYQNKNPNQAQGTNGSGSSGSDSESADDRDGLGRKDPRKSDDRDAFGKTAGGNSPPKGWFGSDSTRDSNAADQSSTFPDAFSPTAFVPLQRTAADEQHFNDFKKLLDSGSAVSALGASGNSAPAQSPLNGILNDSGSARAMAMPGYKPNPVTSLAPAASAAFSSITPILSLSTPMERAAQFRPVLPPRRTF